MIDTLKKGNLYSKIGVNAYSLIWKYYTPEMSERCMKNSNSEKVMYVYVCLRKNKCFASEPNFKFMWFIIHTNFEV